MNIDKETKTDHGMVRVSHDVIGSVASIAAMEVPGVHRVGSIWSRGISELFSKRGGPRGVKVDMKGEDDIEVTVPIVVKYGCHIPDVATLVQEKVKGAIEAMTGVTPAEVNVNVLGVSVPGKNDAEEEEVRT